MVAFDSDLLAALDHVYSLRTTHNIASVNMSLGGDLYTAPCDASLPAFRTIIESLRGANIATVIAAGNDGNAGAISRSGMHLERDQRRLDDQAEHDIELLEQRELPEPARAG